MPSAVAISGSPSSDSRSRRLLAYAAGRLSHAGFKTRLIDLCHLPADALLARTESQGVAEALDAVSRAQLVAVSTPVYRAAYTGLLKAFFDLLPPDALVGKVAIPIATGASPGHQLVIDHALRPLFASIGATVIATGVYGTDSQFHSEGPDTSLTMRLERAVDEGLALARVFDGK